MLLKVSNQDIEIPNCLGRLNLGFIYYIIKKKIGIDLKTLLISKPKR